MIMIESEGITENVKNWRTDVISAITSALPPDKIMFEAADPDAFAYHIQNQGAEGEPVRRPLADSAACVLAPWDLGHGRDVRAHRHIRGSGRVLL
ncbi:hypothetical protein A0H81_13501 [Grifola frondosa]|uniref:Uncharacterized protein n=1 Tax=Grifola frondosa TaxID=5627 RepID=A0A1C7LR96_GRIFR|nr:hypothetical protein A0H81_13501 [Grifola frondosa]